MRFPRVVLTPEEKTALVFVVAAFVLGLTTKHYRDMHRHLSPAPAVQAGQTATPASDSDE
jgi:hypothetical protein